MFEPQSVPDSGGRFLACALTGSGIWVGWREEFPLPVPLALFAGMTIAYTVAVSFLRDTTGQSIPETPHDVEVLEGNVKYLPVENGLEKKLEEV